MKCCLPMKMNEQHTHLSTHSVTRSITHSFTQHEILLKGTIIILEYAPSQLVGLRAV